MEKLFEASKSFPDRFKTTRFGLFIGHHAVLNDFTRIDPAQSLENAAGTIFFLLLLGKLPKVITRVVKFPVLLDNLFIKRDSARVMGCVEGGIF